MLNPCIRFVSAMVMVLISGGAMRAQPAPAGAIYGHSLDAAPVQVYRQDLQTGEVTSVAILSNDFFFSPATSAFDPAARRLFYLVLKSGVFGPLGYSVVTVNLGTGVVTQRDLPASILSADKPQFDPLTGSLYFVGNSTGDPHLESARVYRYDLATGSLATLVELGVNRKVTATALDSAGRRLFVFENDLPPLPVTLLTVNVDSGTITGSVPVGPVAHIIETSPVGLRFDPVNNSLYMVSREYTYFLDRLDIATGATTLVAFLSDAYSGVEDGGAFDPVSRLYFVPVLNRMWAVNVDTGIVVSKVTPPSTSGIGLQAEQFAPDVPTVITFVTQPPGLAITIDGVSYPGPYTFTWMSGSAHNISGQVQTDGSTTYALANWSDTGNVSHTIVTPSIATTYTANYGIASSITVTTVPAGLGMKIDNVAYTSPQSFFWAQGTSHSLATDLIENNGTAAYQFVNWSDAGAMSHFVTVPASPAIYTAAFTTASSSTVPITVTTLRGGLGFTVDGVTYTAAQTFHWAPGSTHALAASTQYFKDGTMYGFFRWSNGAATPFQSITTPDTGTSFTAAYEALTYVTVLTDPVGLGVVVDGSPYGTPQAFYWWPNSRHALSTNQVQTRPEANYSFAGWSNGGPMAQTVVIPESATSYKATFTPAKPSSILSITSSQTTSVAGQMVTLKVAVGPGPQAELIPGVVANGIAANGIVHFSEGARTLGSAGLSQGQAFLVFAFATGGAHTVTASYDGDGNYLASTASFVQMVNPVPAAVSLNASVLRSVFGQVLTLTARVGPLPPGSTAPSVDGVAAPSGQIQFLDGPTVIGTSTLVSNAATLTMSSLPAGSHQLTAMYAGDTSWAATRSGPLTQIVGKASTAMVLAGIAELNQVILTATVNAGPPATGTASGSVQFVDSTTNAVLGGATIVPSGASASFAIGARQVASIIGHPIRAVFQESENFTPSTSNSIVVPALINSATGASTSFAAEELVSVFGSNLAGSSLATATPLPGVMPLPTDLGGTSVTVTDSTGASRLASLYFSSPGQINFVVPAGTAPGAALVTLSSSSPLGDLMVTPVRISIGSVAPGLFATAQILRIRADGSRSLEDASSPIAMRSDTLYLVLFGTGMRNRTSLANVTFTIHEMILPVLYAGAQAQFPGLDQADVLLPASLKGAGKVSTMLTVDGQISNTIMLEFQ